MVNILLRGFVVDPFEVSNYEVVVENRNVGGIEVITRKPKEVTRELNLVQRLVEEGQNVVLDSNGTIDQKYANLIIIGDEVGLGPKMVADLRASEYRGGIAIVTERIQDSKYINGIISRGAEVYSKSKFPFGDLMVYVRRVEKGIHIVG